MYDLIAELVDIEALKAIAESRNRRRRRNHPRKSFTPSQKLVVHQALNGQVRKIITVDTSKFEGGDFYYKTWLFTFSGGIRFDTGSDIVCNKTDIKELLEIQSPNVPRIEITLEQLMLNWIKYRVYGIGNDNRFKDLLVASWMLRNPDHPPLKWSDEDMKDALYFGHPLKEWTTQEKPII